MGPTTKKTYEQIKQSFESEGYTLLSTEYKNARSYLEYVCPNGHKHIITGAAWQQGRRCGICGGPYHITYETIKQSFESEGYTLLSTEYTGIKQYLHYICPDGNHHKIRWNNWQKGKRFSKCYKPKLTYEQVNLSFESEGYTLVSTEYTNGQTPLHYICSNGHNHKIIWKNWQQGHRCGICKLKDSKSEKEILAHVESIYDGIIKPNDRTMIQNPKTGEFLELDIWMPEIKKAIEYNGTYWHSSKYSKWKDAYKAQWCINNGIKLLVINENDWVYNNDFNMIQEFIKGLQFHKNVI